MARFFLHFRSGAEFVEDEQGIELTDEHAAEAAAIRSLRAILANDMRDGVLNPAALIEIEDARHQSLRTVLFEDTLEIFPDAGQSLIRLHAWLNSILCNQPLDIGAG
jgi:hypothetical protein